MSKNVMEQAQEPQRSENLSLSDVEDVLGHPQHTCLPAWTRRRWLRLLSSAFVLLLILGVFAKQGWLPHTDPLSGQKTGWFGRELPKNTTGSVWNPFAMPTASPTPQLSKEYVYAGSRLLAVEDANVSSISLLDLAVWRPKTGDWYMLDDPEHQEVLLTFGEYGDIPVQGDFDGDGLTDFAVFKPSGGYTQIIRSTDKQSYDEVLGGTGDIPAPGDFDGDGRTDISLWGASTQSWTIKLSSDNSVVTQQMGLAADQPLAGDFDGDGVADKAYWRASDHTFHATNSSDSETQIVSMGTYGGQPVCGDYDGDGRSDFALLAGNVWTIRSSSDGTFTNTTWQTAGDIAVPNDYDGDGRTDIAVWHPTTGSQGETAFWYILQSADLTTRTEELGKSGDIPVPALWRR